MPSGVDHSRKAQATTRKQPLLLLIDAKRAMRAQLELAVKRLRERQERLAVVATMLLISTGPVASCTSTQTPLTTASASQAPATSNPTPAEWTTYMGDQARTGIGPTSPTASTAHRTWTAHVDGDVYAEPLVTGLTVIVATERDTIYSLDAATGAVIWRTHLGEPVPLSRLECGNIDPNGITSTPVVDKAAGFVYAVGMLTSPTRHELFALRLSDGSVGWHRVVDPPIGDPGHHQQRGSLNLSRGRIYFSYGGFTGDCGKYHGWVVAVPVDGTSALISWQVPSVNGGAIWAPPGPVISGDGDVWVTTGNTDVQNPNGRYDGAHAVYRLTADLTPVDQWASKNWVDLNVDDIDLASMSPALLPSGLVLAVGKEGQGYLLRQSRLGGIGGEVFSDHACQTGGPTLGAFGGAAVVGAMVFVPCKDGLNALRINVSAPSFALVWHAAPYANSPVLAYGLLWTVVSNAGTYRGHWTGKLVGLDPASGAIQASIQLGPVPHYPSPAAGGGSLYVSGEGLVYALSVT